MALTELWGIAPLDSITEVYEQQNETTLDRPELLLAIDICLVAGCPFSLELDELVHESLYVIDGERYNLATCQKGKPRYVPARAELLRYTDSLYFERNAAYLALRNFFVLAGLSPEKAEELADETVLHVELEDSPDSVVDDLERMGFSFSSEKAVRRFISLYVDLQNNTRLWSNNGYTPAELHTLSGGPAPASGLPARTVKIGRNEPCPCGSGKKYKRCCGTSV